nr:uroporphyrinogen decarboxylase family protein [Limosilactobacillus fermentum]
MKLSLSNTEVLKALHNQEVKHVPISFWRHFAESEFTDASQEPAVLDINLQGHRDYYQAVDVDFAKTMLDGYFPYPFRGVTDPKDVEQLKKLSPLDEDDPWIRGQVELAKQQEDLAGDRPVFITVFSPLILLKWALIEHYVEPLLLSDQLFADLYEQDSQLVSHVLGVIAKDLTKVVTALKKETGITGIFYSTQSIQDQRLDNHEFFDQVMEPIDISVQDEINHQFEINILHICGFDGATNHLEWFTNYPLQVINWATLVDHYSLAEGKKLFGDRVVLGGIDNSVKGVLYARSKEEIQQEVRRLIDEAGKQGVILGADCTVPRDIPYEHLQWAIEEAHRY